jgi:hypothetical protein
MSNLIDINDVTTYTNKVIDAIKMNKKFTDETIDELFSNCFFLCCHICCTINIDNYKNYGILVPFSINENKQILINETLKEILLRPFINDKQYKLYVKKYDDFIVKSYEKDKNLIENWYGKYSCVCFTLDNLNKITIKNPVYEPIINCYGGEILRDIGIPEKKLFIIAKEMKSYAIFFKLEYSQMKNRGILFSNVYEHMKRIYNNEKSYYGFESNINRGILPTEIVKICEVKEYE